MGVSLLMLALLSLVITSLIGNIMALSRLFYALAKDGIISKKAAEINEDGNPSKAIFLVVIISCLIPFLGRTAIGWVVDVTTIGATLIYGYISYCVLKMAKNMEDRHELWTGRIGTALMIIFALYLLVPNLVVKGSIAKETYFLFIVWSVLGFLFFRYLLRKDKEQRFGRSIIVWIALLSLVLLVSLIWMRQSMIASNEVMITNVEHYYEETGATGERPEDVAYVEEQMRLLNEADTRTMLMAIGMFSFTLIIMLTNHSYMNKRTRESEMLANTDPMTGVKSKHAYLVKEAEINSAIEQGKADPFAVAVCDVNGLKKINDTLGHKAGDDYIRAACRLVCEIFRHSPVYRIGGDEFLVIMTGRDYLSRKDLMLLLHNRSVEHISSGGVVISGGISDFNPEADHSYHDVFERADELMYEEKILLKGLGSITRDETPENADTTIQKSSDTVINIRKNILIVEDEMVNLALLGEYLKEYYDLLYASDGMEAIEQMRAHKNNLALVLLDIHMPRMSGMEVLHFVKKDSELSHIPVIVLTADQNAEVECLQLGALDFIQKPYPSREVVLARVTRCIELSEDREIIESTERDALTTLFTIEYFERYVKIYDQHYWNMPMDAVILDINRFHMVNERYGRQYGDEMLRAIGGCIRQFAREVGGVGCRRSGDTFLMYCPHRESYLELRDRICDALGQDVSSKNRVRIRIGVYSIVNKELSIEQRFDRAKMAADSVKKGGYVNPIEFYNSKMHESALYREQLLESFHSSIEQGRFSVYFQPKMNIRKDSPVLVSAEALVRWEHPEFGILAPCEFIPLLEENGLILEMDTYVWRKTAAQIRAWKDRFGFSVPVSVNISRIDLLNPNIKDILSEILKDNSLTPENMMLEITESAYAGASDQVITTARELSKMGFLIEMDDFGTGYSSLSMLTQLPIDALKMDLSFVQNITVENADLRMLELILDIAARLNVPVVAEGVETEEQFKILKELGCDIVQGYYFSNPVPAEEFEKFLK